MQTTKVKKYAIHRDGKVFEYTKSDSMLMSWYLFVHHHRDLGGICEDASPFIKEAQLLGYESKRVYE